MENVLEQKKKERFRLLFNSCLPSPVSINNIANTTNVSTTKNLPPTLAIILQLVVAYSKIIILL